MPSSSEWFELCAGQMLASDPNLTEEVIRIPGSTANNICNIGRLLGDEMWTEHSQEMEDIYRDTARGDALTRLITSEYGVPREGATAARVSITIERTDDAAVDIEAGFIVSTADGQRFAFDFPVFWADGDDADKIVESTALELGVGGNVDAATIVYPESTAPDDTMTFTNVERAAGGNEEETDDQYLARTFDAMARFVRGTAPAIVLGALEVERVRTAAAFETLDSEGNPSGGGVVTFADENGHANADLAEEVELELVNWRPFGSHVEVVPAELVYDDISVSAQWEPGKATAANALSLKKAIVARVNNLIPRAAPSGQDPDIRCQLTHAVIQEARLAVKGCIGITVNLPVGTVIPAYGLVIRTTLDRVTVT